jgi:iron complex transport system ATP-binding protein
VPWSEFALLRAADVSFGYGDSPVVRGVSLDVARDGFVGIIGPNGSGKTTLLRLLAGTRMPDTGSVLLDGVSLRTLPRAEIARRMAVVPQETHLAFEYSVLEVVLMGRYPHLGAFAIEGPKDIEVARNALASTGTLDLQSRAFSTLSGGEKQRVIIAAALAQITDGRLKPATTDEGRLRPASTAVGAGFSRPSMLLLDEPTAALDLKYQLEVASLLRSLHASHGLAIVVSTHDLNFAAGLCRTLVMLKQGRVLAAGPVDEVLTPARIRELYDVNAEVTRHAVTGHLMVTPLP